MLLLLLEMLIDERAQVEAGCEPDPAVQYGALAEEGRSLARSLRTSSRSQGTRTIMAPSAMGCNLLRDIAVLYSTLV